VEVGEGTMIGIGAVIIQGIKIGKWTIIGAGAVVVNDIPDYAMVVGVPGKIIKYLKNEN
jgi:acetyltransferase EpsM